MKKVDEENIKEFIKSVKKYCATIENHKKYSVIEFLIEVEKDISILHYNYLQLPEMPFKENKRKGLTGEEWQKLFKSLNDFIGDEYNYYKVIYEPYSKNEEPITGSLSDDLTDIYRDVIDLKKSKKPEEKQAIIWELQLLYFHWGYHLCSAYYVIHHVIQNYMSQGRDTGE